MGQARPAGDCTGARLRPRPLLRALGSVLFGRWRGRWALLQRQGGQMESPNLARLLITPPKEHAKGVEAETQGRSFPPRLRSACPRGLAQTHDPFSAPPAAQALPVHAASVLLRNRPPGYHFAPSPRTRNNNLFMELGQGFPTVSFIPHLSAGLLQPRGLRGLSSQFILTHYSPFPTDK